MFISHELMNSGFLSLLSSSMRKGNSLELAADQANDDPFCYRCVIICATQLVGNPCQFMEVLVFFIAESILLGKTELNPAFFICLMLPLCWSLSSALLEAPCLCCGGWLACSTWNSTSFLWLSLRLVAEITNHTGTQLQTLTSFPSE